MKFSAATPLSIVMLCFLNCSGPAAEPPCAGSEGASASPIVRIEYGTSFGMCAGYCWSAVTLSPGTAASFTKRGWNNAVEEVTCTGDMPLPCDDLWSSIAGDVDLNKFFAMEEIIGCPDCADGGAEWIEIETTDSSHRVTYDYNNPPAALQSVAKNLNEVKSSFADCE